jgi:FolB domain-containing protein
MIRHSEQKQHWDVLRLNDLKVPCIVGVYPQERHKPQLLKADIALFLDTRHAAQSSGLKHTVDYAKRCGEIRFLLQSCQFWTLETAADALAHYLLAPSTPDAPQAELHAVEIELTKPQALSDATPSLRIHRDSSDVSYESETKDFGKVDIIHVSEACGIYRLRLKPNGTIPAHVHRKMDESELVLGSGLRLQGQPVAPGSVFHWKKDFPHRYDNPTLTEQSILCVDRPIFIESDEVVVDIPVQQLPPVKGQPYYPTT